MTDSLFGDSPAPAAPSAITFDAPRDYRLVALAVEERADRLKKLAKQNEDEGYRREADLIRQEGVRLAEDLLPRFADQAELPLATTDELRGAVSNALRALVRKHAREAGDGPNGVDHEAVLLGTLSTRIGKFAEGIARAAFAAGVAYRESTPEAIALRSVDALAFSK